MSDPRLYKWGRHVYSSHLYPTFHRRNIKKIIVTISASWQQKHTQTEVTSTRHEQYNPKILLNVEEYNLLWNDEQILSTLTIYKHRESLLNSLREFMYQLWWQQVQDKGSIAIGSYLLVSTGNVRLSFSADSTTRYPGYNWFNWQYKRCEFTVYTVINL